MKIVFYGGRQAQLLFDLLRRARGGDEANWIDPDAKLGAADERRLAEADVVAVQVRGPAVAAPPETRAEIALFPELALDALWPFGGAPHRANTADELFPHGPFPAELGDVWLNRRLERGGPLETIEAEYLALDVAATIDLDAYLALSLERQREIDRVCGADFAARFEAEFRDHRLFLNPLCPAPEVLRALAAPLFARWGADVPEPALRSEIQAPVHPSVAAHFGLRWTGGWRDSSGAGADFAEYVRRYLAYAEGPELEAGLRLAALGRSQESRVQLALAAARPMGRRWAGARAPDVGARVSQDSAALRAALAQAPGDYGLASRLTVALAAEGDIQGALASAQSQVAQRPDDPQARAVLAHLWERAGDPERAKAQLARALALVASGDEYAALRAALNKRLIQTP